MRLLPLVALLLLVRLAFAASAPRPNILWISSEDHGPQLGCYGDTYATTPNIDKFATRALRYTHAWAAAPVCAPTRTTIISGLHGPSSGGDHMRSLVAYPAGQKMFPQLLREAGYYTANHVKEDYNLAKTAAVWNDSSGQAHWRKRPAGQPFFAVFNSTKSHESQIIKSGPGAKPIHDPAKVRVPAYHPDTPEVRRDWAFYYDSVTEADADAGVVLAQLEVDGLADDTIVFYWADHGSGMPRSKRWPSNSGLHVPLLVHIPEKFKDLRPADYRAGGTTDRLVSFADFAPTMCSLAGIQPPEWMQGYAFLGRFIAPAQPYVYGFRGRMDERYDLVRSVTDGRYVYLRNYLPHLSQGQHVSTQFKTPTTAVWKQRFDEGKATAAQRIFWQTPKAPEELYDLQSDRDEVNNLAGSPAHQAVLEKLRAAQQAHSRRIRDLGFIPEGERLTRAGTLAPYDFGHDAAKYPYERVAAAAELASGLKPEATPALLQLLTDSDSAVRYWGALGLLMRAPGSFAPARAALRTALADTSPYVRIAAAETLARFGDAADRGLALPVLVTLADWGRHDVFTALASLHALDAIGPQIESVRAGVLALPADGPVPDSRYAPYIPRILGDLRASLGAGPAAEPAAKRAKNKKKTGE
ncbi:sulfatase-like hydrolase/transferase [Horticoccus sp. 23ND18S-11]|uniref:sulfatase-like hydrolase/transferase n=1 Tax=Horticoccus sp. 23ND18S-11 TaxID=3391832 RepID=UPI0039C962CE